MTKKRTNSKTKSRKNRTRSEKKSNTKIAQEILSGDGKNPYYYGGITIQNLDELQEHLHNFSEHEANWLADWIDYLGDNQTAKTIRTKPAEFRSIINNRYLELKNIIEDLEE